MQQWELIENDLQDRGIDVGDAQLMRTRSWRWLRVRIIGCLTGNTRIARYIEQRNEANRSEALRQVS